MSVLIVDYGMSNLASVSRAVQECGHDAFISGSPADLDQAAHVILPGVGSFATGMRSLRSTGWPRALRHAALQDGVPLLGICLGMQLLADNGSEGGPADGLGLIPGKVAALRPDTPDTRIPHIGWNEVAQENDSPLFKGVPDHADFYFVHSYHFVPSDSGHIIGRTPYCGGFVSALARGNIFGLQFHPEKSQKYGLQVLANFLDM